MTLRDLMQRHARTVLASTSHHGESVTLHPRTGASRTVQVTIARRGRQSAAGGEGLGHLAVVWIPNDATIGITQFVPGDRLEFAMQEGGESAQHPMHDLAAHDAAGFLINVWA